MQSLIELLQTANMEPNERKTSFLQLNILTQDPELNEMFHNANGLYLCLDALQSALKVSLQAQMGISDYDRSQSLRYVSLLLHYRKIIQKIIMTVRYL